MRPADKCSLSYSLECVGHRSHGPKVLMIPPPFIVIDCLDIPYTFYLAIDKIILIKTEMQETVMTLKALLRHMNSEVG